MVFKPNSVLGVPNRLPVYPHSLDEAEGRYLDPKSVDFVWDLTNWSNFLLFSWDFDDSLDIMISFDSSHWKPSYCSYKDLGNHGSTFSYPHLNVACRLVHMGWHGPESTTMWVKAGKSCLNMFVWIISVGWYVHSSSNVYSSRATSSLVSKMVIYQVLVIKQVLSHETLHEHQIYFPQLFIMVPYIYSPIFCRSSQLSSHT